MSAQIQIWVQAQPRRTKLMTLIPRRFLISKGTKVKLMPAKSEEHTYCFEILIGGTSKRHYIALATYDIFESWLYALREFIPSVMSHLRSLRVKVLGSNDEALEDYKPKELKMLKLKNDFSFWKKLARKKS